MKMTPPWPIGTRVWVQALAFREAEPLPNGRTHMTWTSEPEASPREATVTGYSKRYDGERVPASGGRNTWMGEEDYEPAYFAPTRAHQVVLVRFTPTGKEHAAFPCAVSPAVDDSSAQRLRDAIKVGVAGACGVTSAIEAIRDIFEKEGRL